MKKSVSSGLTLAISLFFVSQGIWGLFRPVTFGILATNRTHAIIQLVLGVAGLLSVWKGTIRGYLGFLGSLMLVIGLLWLIPATRATPTEVLNANLIVALLNLVIGLAALAIAITTVPPRRFGTQPPFSRVKGSTPQPFTKEK